MWVQEDFKLCMNLHSWLTFRLESAGYTEIVGEKKRRVFQAKRTRYVRALKKIVDTSSMEGKPEELPKWAGEWLKMKLRGK